MVHQAYSERIEIVDLISVAIDLRGSLVNCEVRLPIAMFIFLKTLLEGLEKNRVITA